MNSSVNQIIVGTRGSKLALYNTNKFIDKFKTCYPEIKIQLKIIKSQGDIDMRSLEELQSRGIFTRALEEELLKNNIDIAIHSFKDLPLDIDPKFLLAGVLERESIVDIAITKNNIKLDELPEKSIIGTGSQRRIFQLKHFFKNKNFIYKGIRGNIDTRVRKVREGDYDAIIISGGSLPILDNVHYESLSYDVMLVSPAQSAICFQIRKSDEDLMKILDKICNQKSFYECQMEREVLKVLGGGCFNRVAARYFYDKKLLKCRFEKNDGRFYDLEIKATALSEVKDSLGNYL